MAQTKNNVVQSPGKEFGAQTSRAVSGQPADASAARSLNNFQDPAYEGAEVTRVSGQSAEAKPALTSLLESKQKKQNTAGVHSSGHALFQHDVPNEPSLALVDKLSARLSDSYAQMNAYVDQLKHDLISEGKERRQELQEKAQLANSLSTLLEILPAGVIVLDGKGVVTQCNPAAIDLLGEPLVGITWLDVIKRCFAPKRDDGHEVSLKDGRRVRIETRSMQSGPGQLILLTDLTETRLLQAQVSRAERLSSLGKMVASLAHQIRTPLSTAMLYAGHLSQARIDDGTRIACAEKMLARLTHLEHQIRDMLIFAKGETRLAQRVKTKDFANNLRSAAEPIIRKTNIKHYWQVALGDELILCNEEALIGGCVNLVNNALEAMENYQRDEGENQLNVKLQVQSASGSNYLLIEISDNGPGIPEGRREEILEPFYTTKAQGTGLGLSVVKAVVHAHHGELSIESNNSTRSPSGTCISIQLPIFQTLHPKQANSRKQESRYV